MRFFKESGIILLAFVIVFVWQQTFLSQYTIHALVTLTIIYLLLTGRRRDFNLLKTGDSASIFVIIVAVFLLVVSTGGLTSTLFFLLYFLCFGITFAFEPAMVFVFVVLATLWFLQSALSDDVISNFLHIGSLYVIASFAFFFGREVKKDERGSKVTKKTRKKRR